MKSGFQNFNFAALAIFCFLFIPADVSSDPIPPSSGILNSPTESVCEYRFEDGVKIRVYFTDQTLQKYGEDGQFPKDVLDAAVGAYQTITQFLGFSTPGYTFAKPDKNYAYDPDRTIDIYLGDPNEKRFKDAPCFDILKLSDTQFQALILLPVNYKAFIHNWECLNPSLLGARNISVDLKGTLIHEMLHVILFYYNKNLNKEFQQALATGPGAGERPSSKEIDWYVEGLARYFETFAGARHDFFSQGFKQTFPDRIRFSRGGSNYFMRYPDQAFTHLRYENAIFWRFIDERYGMKTIEALSRDFRNAEPEGFKGAVERATGVPFNELLKAFAAAILFKDFNLKEDSVYLQDIAKTHLLYKNENLCLVDGFGREKRLGKVCRTDWIGQWGAIAAALGEFPVGGDNTQESDVSGWATDFYQIDLESGISSLPWLGVWHTEGGEGLAVQVFLVTRGGSWISREIQNIKKSTLEGLALDKEIRREGLETKDIQKIYLLITNTDPKILSHYEIVIKS